MAGRTGLRNPFRNVAKVNTSTTVEPQVIGEAVDKIVSPEPEGQENVVVAAFQSSI